MEHDPWRPRDAEAMLKNADRAVYLNPDLWRYLPGAKFLPYASVDVASIEPRPVPEREQVVIAHAPTKRSVKGTEDVVAAVGQICATKG